VRCFAKGWPGGQGQMIALAHFHYNLDDDKLDQVPTPAGTPALHAQTFCRQYCTIGA